MALTFGTTADQSAKWIRALVYGPSGIGKTTSATTLPEDRTLVVSFERKLLPLSGKKFPCVIINSWSDLDELRYLFASQAPVRIDGQEIKTIFIDSLTAMGELAKQAIVERFRPELIRNKTRGKTDKPEGIYDDQLDIKDWGKLASMVQTAIVSFTSLPCNVIFTALEKPLGEVARRIMLDGKVGQTAPSYFDLVFYMRELRGDERGRVWQTGITPDLDVFAKDASGKLDLYETTDWPHIMRKLHGVAPSTKSPKEH